MGITKPTGLDILNKALPKVKENIIDPDELELGTYQYSALDILNEGLRFFYGFEGRTYLKRHVNLELKVDQVDYEVNETNFAKDFLIERILEDEVQSQFGDPVTRMTRDQYIKYVVPFQPLRNQELIVSQSIPPGAAPKMWYPNPQSDDDGKSIIYFSIYPGVTKAQTLFVPYQVAMTEEIDPDTLDDEILIPLNDIDALVYYVAFYLASIDSKPNTAALQAEYEEKMLASSVAYKLFDDTGEFDLSRGMARVAHGGL